MNKLIGRHIFLRIFVFGVLINFFSHPVYADPVQWFHNGHWYDLVNAPMINWYEADTDSKNLQFEGKKGHLVTITSEAENQFLIDTFGKEIENRWIGSYQVEGSPEPNGGWRWVTGEPWDYTNWDTIEPNNAGGNENSIVFTGDLLWNDKDASDGAHWIPGYVIEYGPTDINDFVTFDPIPSSYLFSTDTTGCPPNYTGKFNFEARLVYFIDLTNLTFEIAKLNSGNLILNDHLPCGVGDWFLAPKVGANRDGVLGGLWKYSYDAPFTVCLKKTRPFQLYVNVLGEPLPSSVDIVESPFSTAIASNYSDGYPPEDAIDGELDTRWAAKGDGQWLELRLINRYTIGSVKIAWFNGDSRRALFDILVGEEVLMYPNVELRWSNVFSGQSSGETSNLEEYDLAHGSGDRVRIVGHGNTEDMWNSIAEVEIYAEANTSKIPITGISVSSDQPGPPPENMIDGNFGTSWVTNTDGDFSRCWEWHASDPESFPRRWAEFGLGFEAQVRKIKIAWRNGDKHRTSFDIYVFDGFNGCVKVYSGQSSGTTSEFETYHVPSTWAGHSVLIVGNGNAEDDWIDIAEVEIWGHNAFYP